MVIENGEKIVLFKPLEPYETPSAVERLCEEYNKAFGEGIVDPLNFNSKFHIRFLMHSPI